MEVMARYAEERRIVSAMRSKETQDVSYIHKIVDLVQEKWKLFGPQDVLPKFTIMERTESAPKKALERVKTKRLRLEKKIQKGKPINENNHVTQRLKEFITNVINGKEVKAVIEKKLYASDLKEDQNRLNIPKNQVVTEDFLTEEEKNILEKKGELKVKLWGPRLQKHRESMKLKIWQMKSTDNFVLKHKWNGFVKANKEDMKENTEIQVWSFRKEGKLCFAIACLEGVDGQNDIGGGSGNY